MSKNKERSAPKTPQKPAKKANGPRTMVMIAAVALVVMSGFVLATRAGAVPVPAGAVALRESSGVQALDLTANNSFSPAEIVAKAGTPIELRYGVGTGCAQAVVMPELGVNQDIRKGGVVKVDAGVKPGKYEIFCQLKMDMGTLYVR